MPVCSKICKKYGHGHGRDQQVEENQLKILLGETINRQTSSSVRFSHAYDQLPRRAVHL